VLIFGIPLRCLPFTILSKTDWIRIATEIELNYTSFDAFVVLHGTDTMSYTSSALSFLLEDLGKTVVRLTSSNNMIILTQRD
jgi:L-asparaginase/Glu-tRNA(Gln) amidotransferase subunit D